jgi:hypothetical protein
MKSIVILTAVILAGCAAPRYAPISYKDAGPTTQREQEMAQALRECDYDAEKATIGFRNGFEGGFNKAILRRKCMESKGFGQM